MGGQERSRDLVEELIEWSQGLVHIRMGYWIKDNRYVTLKLKIKKYDAIGFDQTQKRR